MVNNLKQRRNECGLTQAEVASAANVTTVCYQLYEYNKRIPRADVAIVNEAGLYSVLFALQPTKARGVSDKYIEARQKHLHDFKRWITHDVIPTIRKTGGYVANDDLFA